MSTSNLLATAISTALTAGTILGTGVNVYHGQAVDLAPLPYVVFSLNAGGPMNITPSNLRDDIYFVRAYAASALQAGTIDALASGALHNKTLTVTGYTNVRTVRELDLELVETQPNGQLAYMAGGMYRITIDG